MGHFLCFETSPSSPCDIELWSWKKGVCKFGGGRVWGISVDDPCFPSFKIFSTKAELRKTHNCTAYPNWGVKAPSGGIFHSSLFLSAGQVKKNGIIVHCAWLVYLSRFILLLSFFQLRCCVRVKLKMEFCKI